MRTIVAIPLALLCLVLLGNGNLWSGDPAEVLPNDPRDASIESPEKFFGFPVGSRHLRHDEVVAYWKYLSQSSDRVTLIPYGTTHGRRPLMVAAITSPENSSQLDAICKSRRRLTTGSFSGALDQQLLVMSMGYSVHGDEASAINAAPLVAYHLVSSNSPQVSEWLEHGLFLIDPALNPDGIDRFANWANENRGRWASPSAIDREHNQPWPGGRTNYYWFDLNRDWLPIVHPESQGRLKLFHAWKPNVVLDFHEMSGDASFFFQPGVPARNNPLSPAMNLELTRRFSAEHARSMDAAGELYFTEERFDDFYVGKGSTYPDLHGAVGILFEQGSTRGLKLRNERTDRHFQDTVANQVRTSLSSLRMAHLLRRELLEFQTGFYADSLAEGRQDPIRGYVLTGTTSRIIAAEKLLRAHAIAAYRPPSDIHLQGKTHAVDHVLVVPCDQPEYAFVKSLMEPLQDFRENLFYDVSTWHLPSALDLEMHRIDFDLPQAWLPPHANSQETSSNSAEVPSKADIDLLAGYAFLPVELEVPSLVASLQKLGTELRVTTDVMHTRVGDHVSEWPIGTFLILRQANQKRWKPITTSLGKLAAASGIEIQPIHSGITEVGPDLGSDSTLNIPRCQPLLVVGAGTQSYSAGQLWHYLDVRMGQPSTLVDSERLASVDLREFSVVVLPDGSYSDWGQSEVDHLKDYVRGGGTVIAISSAIRWLERRELIELGKPPARENADDPSQPLRFGDARDAAALESIAGAFLAVNIDPTHPLAYGFPDASVPVFRDHTATFSPTGNPFKVAAKYDAVLAGYVSTRNRDRLAGSVAAWVEPSGSGRFILLADEPVFRGYVRSSERFLSNALLLGPAIRIPSMPSAEAAHVDGHEH